MKKTRILSLLMAAALSLTLFSACGEDKASSDFVTDSELEVTLKWVVPVAAQSDLNVVQDKVNEMLPSLLPNTKIELICDSAVGDKWQLWMSGKMSFDIVASGFAFSLQEEIMKNSFLPLDQLVENYAPTIKAEREGLFHSAYMTGEYNGQLYAIPNIQYHTKETTQISVSKSIAEYLDIDRLVSVAHATPKTTEEFYQILDEFMAKASEAKGGKVQLDMEHFWGNNIAKRGYVFVGGELSTLCYDAFADQVKIIDFCTTEEFKTFIKYASKWYKEGYIAKDILTGAVGTSGNTTVGTLSGYIGSRYGADDRWVIDNITDPTYNIVLDDPKFDIAASHSIGSLMTYQSIPVTAENPARAMKLLELLRTEQGKDVLNTLVYGIEGTHYEKTGDNTIKAFDYLGQGSSSSKYGIPNWHMGNLFNMYVIAPYDMGVYNYGKNYYETYDSKVQKHKLYGLCFDIQPVRSAMSQLLSNNKEYLPQLTYGVMADYQSTYDTLLSRAQAAGIQKVIDEFQKQADDYIASK